MRSVWPTSVDAQYITPCLAYCPGSWSLPFCEARALHTAFKPFSVLSTGCLHGPQTPMLSGSYLSNSIPGGLRTQPAGAANLAALGQCVYFVRIRASSDPGHVEMSYRKSDAGPG